MKWYQRPPARLIFRTTAYTMLCVTLSIFLLEMARFASDEAKLSLDLTAVDYLTACLQYLLGSAIVGIVFAGPGGLALGSIAAAILDQACPARFSAKFVRGILGFIVLIALLPVIFALPEIISMLDGAKARLIGLMMIVPLGLALRWSQLVADRYISEATQSEASESALHPRKRMIWRAAATSVALGVPVMTAYVWLFVTVADTWYTFDGPGFLLLVCLTLGAAGLALLGSTLGAIMALVTKLAPGRMDAGARCRTLVSLVPLFFLVPLITPSQPSDIEKFLWKLRAGFSIEKLEAAGWLLAIAFVVGVCQITFTKYQRETTGPKNDNPIRLWRAIPLVTVVSALVVCGAAFSILSHALYASLFEPEAAARPSEIKQLLRAARDGLSVGLIFGSALALTIMLFFSEIRRPRVFRLSILGIAVLVAFALWGPFIDFALSASLLVPEHNQRILPPLVEMTLFVITTVLMGEAYRRAAKTTARKRSA